MADADVPALVDCPTGRQLVGWLSVVLDHHERVGGGLFFSNGLPVQKVRDAINAPKTELGIEIPFWPWSDEPTYCDGSPQKDGAMALVTTLDASTATNDQEDQRRKDQFEKTLGDWFHSWWGPLWTSVKVALVIGAVVLLAWVVRSFRSVT